MQIITVYTGSFLFTLKNAVVVITYICLIYLFPFNHFILNKIQKNHNTSHRYHAVEKMWIKNINTSNNTSNGSFYLLQNISQYKTGFISELMNVYTVSDGYLTHYINYKKAFITKSNNSEQQSFDLTKSQIIFMQRILKNNPSIDKCIKTCTLPPKDFITCNVEEKNAVSNNDILESLLLIFLLSLIIMWLPVIAITFFLDKWAKRFNN